MRKKNKVKLGCERIRMKKKVNNNSNRKKKKKVKYSSAMRWDEEVYLAFIAGYTSGGAPFGITYEEWMEIEQSNSEIEDEEWKGIVKSNLMINFEDLPF